MPIDENLTTGSPQSQTKQNQEANDKTQNKKQKVYGEDYLIDGYGNVLDTHKLRDIRPIDFTAPSKDDEIIDYNEAKKRDDFDFTKVVSDENGDIVGYRVEKEREKQISPNEEYFRKYVYNPTSLEDYDLQYEYWRRVHGLDAPEISAAGMLGNLDVDDPLLEELNKHSRYDNALYVNATSDKVALARYQNQGTAGRLATGVGGMAVKTFTSFLDNTVGFAGSLGEGLFKGFTGDNSFIEDFKSGFFDGEVTKAFKELDDEAEKLTPIYEDPRFKDEAFHFDSALWGNLIKQSGFMVGMVLAGAATKGLFIAKPLAKLLVKGINSLRGVKYGLSATKKVKNIEELLRKNEEILAKVKPYLDKGDVLEDALKAANVSIKDYMKASQGLSKIEKKAYDISKGIIGKVEESEGVKALNALAESVNKAEKIANAGVKNIYAEKVTKYTAKAINLVSAMTEGLTEARNAAAEYRSGLADELQAEYYAERYRIQNDKTLTKEQKEAKLKELYNRYNSGLINANKNAKNVAAATWLMNVPLLMFDNAFTLEKFWSGGAKNWNTAIRENKRKTRKLQKELEKKKVSTINTKDGAEEAVQQTIQQSKGKLGKLKDKFDDFIDKINSKRIISEEVIDGKVYETIKNPLLRSIGKNLNSGIIEGLEEMNQGVASETAKAYYSNAVLDDFKYGRGIESTSALYSVFDSINKEITQTQFMNVYGDAKRWEEFFSGFMTSMLPMISFGKANNKNAMIGKNKTIGLHWGIVDEFRNYREIKSRDKEALNTIKSVVEDPTKQQQLLSYMRALDINRDKAYAILEGDETKFNAANDKELLNIIQSFNMAGKLDYLKALASVALNHSDENVKAILGDARIDNSDGIAYSNNILIDENGNPITGDRAARILDRRVSKIHDVIDAYATVMEDLKELIPQRDENDKIHSINVVGDLASSIIRTPMVLNRALQSLSNSKVFKTALENARKMGTDLDMLIYQDLVNLDIASKYAKNPKEFREKLDEFNKNGSANIDNFFDLMKFLGEEISDEDINALKDYYNNNLNKNGEHFNTVTEMINHFKENLNNKKEEQKDIEKKWNKRLERKKKKIEKEAKEEAEANLYYEDDVDTSNTLPSAEEIANKKTEEYINKNKLNKKLIAINEAIKKLNSVKINNLSPLERIYGKMSKAFPINELGALLERYLTKQNTANKPIDGLVNLFNIFGVASEGKTSKEQDELFDELKKVASLLQEYRDSKNDINKYLEMPSMLFEDTNKVLDNLRGEYNKYKYRDLLGQFLEKNDPNNNIRLKELNEKFDDFIKFLKEEEVLNDSEISDFYDYAVSFSTRLNNSKKINAFLDVLNNKVKNNTNTSSLFYLYELFHYTGISPLDNWNELTNTSSSFYDINTLKNLLDQVKTSSDKALRDLYNDIKKLINNTKDLDIAIQDLKDAILGIDLSVLKIKPEPEPKNTTTTPPSSSTNTTNTTTNTTNTNNTNIVNGLDEIEDIELPDEIKAEIDANDDFWIPKLVEEFGVTPPACIFYFTNHLKNKLGDKLTSLPLFKAAIRYIFSEKLIKLKDGEFFEDDGITEDIAKVLGIVKVKSNDPNDATLKQLLDIYGYYDFDETDPWEVFNAPFNANKIFEKIKSVFKNEEFAKKVALWFSEERKNDINELIALNTLIDCINSKLSANKGKTFFNNKGTTNNNSNNSNNNSSNNTSFDASNDIKCREKKAELEEKRNKIANEVESRKDELNTNGSKEDIDLINTLLKAVNINLDNLLNSKSQEDFDENVERIDKWLDTIKSTFDEAVKPEAQKQEEEENKEFDESGSVKVLDNGNENILVDSNNNPVSETKQEDDLVNDYNNDNNDSTKEEEAKELLNEINKIRDIIDNFEHDRPELYKRFIEYIDPTLGINIHKIFKISNEKEALDFLKEIEVANISYTQAFNKTLEDFNTLRSDLNTYLNKDGVITNINQVRVDSEASPEYDYYRNQITEHYIGNQRGEDETIISKLDDLRKEDPDYYTEERCAAIKGAYEYLNTIGAYDYLNNNKINIGDDIEFQIRTDVPNNGYTVVMVHNGNVCGILTSEKNNVLDKSKKTKISAPKSTQVIYDSLVKAYKANKKDYKIKTKVLETVSGNYRLNCNKGLQEVRTIDGYDPMINKIFVNEQRHLVMSVNGFRSIQQPKVEFDGTNFETKDYDNRLVNVIPHWLDEEHIDQYADILYNNGVQNYQDIVKYFKGVSSDKSGKCVERFILANRKGSVTIDGHNYQLQELEKFEDRLEGIKEFLKLLCKHYRLKPRLMLRPQDQENHTAFNPEDLLSHGLVFANFKSFNWKDNYIKLSPLEVIDNGSELPSFKPANRFNVGFKKDNRLNKEINQQKNNDSNNGTVLWTNKYNDIEIIEAPEHSITRQKGESSRLEYQLIFKNGNKVGNQYKFYLDKDNNVEVVLLGNQSRMAVNSSHVANMIARIMYPQLAGVPADSIRNYPELLDANKGYFLVDNNIVFDANRGTLLSVNHTRNIIINHVKKHGFKRDKNGKEIIPSCLFGGNLYKNPIYTHKVVYNENGVPIAISSTINRNVIAKNKEEYDNDKTGKYKAYYIEAFSPETGNIIIPGINSSFIIQYSDKITNLTPYFDNYPQIKEKIKVEVFSIPTVRRLLNEMDTIITLKNLKQEDIDKYNKLANELTKLLNEHFKNIGYGFNSKYKKFEIQYDPNTNKTDSQVMLFNFLNKKLQDISNLKTFESETTTVSKTGHKIITRIIRISTPDIDDLGNVVPVGYYRYKPLNGKIELTRITRDSEKYKYEIEDILSYGFREVSLKPKKGKKDIKVITNGEKIIVIKGDNKPQFISGNELLELVDASQIDILSKEYIGNTEAKALTIDDIKGIKKAEFIKDGNVEVSNKQQVSLQEQINEIKNKIKQLEKLKEVKDKEVKELEEEYETLLRLYGEEDQRTLFKLELLNNAIRQNNQYLEDLIYQRKELLFRKAEELNKKLKNTVEVSNKPEENTLESSNNKQEELPQEPTIQEPISTQPQPTNSIEDSINNSIDDTSNQSPQVDIKEETPKNSGLTQEKLDQLSPKEDDDIDPFSEVTDNDTTLTKEDFVKAQQLVRRLLGSRFADQMVQLDDFIRIANSSRRAQGAYRKGIIRLCKEARYGTVSHEMFHLVLDLFCSEKQKQALFDEYSKLHPNIKARYDSKGDLIYNKERMLEEAMADDFRDYMISNEHRSLGQKIKDFFRKLKWWITNWNSIEPTFDNICEAIRLGKFKNYNTPIESNQDIRLSMSSNSYDRYNRSAEKKNLQEALAEYFEDIELQTEKDEATKQALKEYDYDTYNELQSEKINHGRANNLSVHLEEEETLWETDEDGDEYQTYGYSNYLEEIYNNYSNAIGRTSNYRGNLQRHIANGYGIIWSPFENDNSVLVGQQFKDIFVVSHFAPSSLRKGVDLIKKAANNRMPIVMAVPEYQANQLEKAGFRFIAQVPQMFAGEVVMKNVMVNKATTQKDIDDLLNHFNGNDNTYEVGSYFSEIEPIDDNKISTQETKPVEVQKWENLSDFQREFIESKGISMIEFIQLNEDIQDQIIRCL